MRGFYLLQNTRGEATHQFIYFLNPIILVEEEPIPSKLSIKRPEWVFASCFSSPQKPYHVLLLQNFKP
jgi:hypothetical protein